MDMVVTPDNRLQWQGQDYRCALGAGGISPEKKEGDGATPVGRFALHRLLYRADKVDAPATGISDIAALKPSDGWCDDPADPNYNRQISHPYPASAERLWRDDGLYDVIVVLGHNDDPPVAGDGSAIFLHVARPDYGPTEGCVALALPDLLAVLNNCDENTHLRVER